ncbi:hypothetical protein NX059_002713 [Plenodomus lindquistii]|nr:hypothetical protein NX059_002713 [Plenodomus lindquistii]
MKISQLCFLNLVGTTLGLVSLPNIGRNIGVQARSGYDKRQGDQLNYPRLAEDVNAVEKRQGDQLNYPRLAEDVNAAEKRSA